MTRRLNDPPPMNAPPAAETTGDTNKPKGKAGDRFATLNAFLDFTAQHLGRAECLTWLALWRDVKRDGVATTAQADIARRIGAHRGTIKRAITKLVAAGLLTVARRGSLRRGASAYRVHPVMPIRTKPPKR
ncbi:MAG: helix-turn-helix domain-containing protein [Thermoguttaceae bacterium]|jgi:hypothetical protein|nr:helix-turn-helix domain-containing protein [Thermoguttaceae bacterium]